MRGNTQTKKFVWNEFRSLNYIVCNYINQIRNARSYDSINFLGPDEEKNIKELISRLENNLSYREIKRIEYVPNSINLFNRIKEKLKNNLDIKSSKINLININETEFLNKIDLINKEKKII